MPGAGGGAASTADSAVLEAIGTEVVGAGACQCWRRVALVTKTFTSTVKVRKAMPWRTRREPRNAGGGASPGGDDASAIGPSSFFAATECEQSRVTVNRARCPEIAALPVEKEEDTISRSYSCTAARARALTNKISFGAPTGHPPFLPLPPLLPGSPVCLISCKAGTCGARDLSLDSPAHTNSSLTVTLSHASSRTPPLCVERLSTRRGWR